MNNILRETGKYFKPSKQKWIALEKEHCKNIKELLEIKLLDDKF